jgi:hypothetical protein
MMEGSLSINNIQKTTPVSDSFRKKLVELGYRKFDGKPIKGEICYDAYYKDFNVEKELKYTIYCYCYDLKGMLDNPELFEFAFETQINAGAGVIGLEAIQWDFRTEESSEFNIRFFENRVDAVWKSFGSIKFPS